MSWSEIGEIIKAVAPAFTARAASTASRESRDKSVIATQLLRRFS